MKAFGETALASLFVGRVWFWTDASLLAMELAIPARTSAGCNSFDTFVWGEIAGSLITADMSLNVRRLV